MRNPLRALRDYSRTGAAAEQLLASVVRARPGGVDVSRQDPEMAAAVMVALKRYPNLKVARFKHNLTLGFTEDFNSAVTPALLSNMEAAGIFAKPNEDLNEH
jgi:hypothetical protein